jgi:tRNA (guanosine-2'-O-)-methyltransferase
MKVVLLVSLGATIATSCGPGTGAKSAHGLAIVHIEAPVGVTLVEACTPTGPEICFNAVDDNCNGVIDEGCGIATGPLQFTVAWGDSPADVVLRVTDPSSDFVDDNHPTRSDERLRLDRDCPKDACYGQNIENVLWGGLDPPRGSYGVDVFLDDLHGAPLPVSVRFGARVGSRSYGADLTLDTKDDKKHFVFTL